MNLKVKLSLEETLEVARMAHDVNTAYCRALGDFNLPVWEDLPKRGKRGIINGVTFLIDNPYATEGATHKNWLKYKEANGWEFGKVIDIEEKRHPAIVSFCLLSKEQRAKFYIFTQIVRGMVSFIESKGVS